MADLPTPPLFEAPARGNPLEFWDETYPRKTRGMGLLHGENCVILASTVFDWSTRVTDGQTDGIAMAYTRYSYAVARKKGKWSSQATWQKFGWWGLWLIFLGGRRFHIFYPFCGQNNIFTSITGQQNCCHASRRPRSRSCNRIAQECINSIIWWSQIIFFNNLQVVGSSAHGAFGRQCAGI